MKNIISLIIGIIIYVSTNGLNVSQTYNIPVEKLPMKPLYLTEQQQIDKVIQFIIQYFGKSFKLFEQLKAGNYIVEKDKNTNNQFVVKIFSEQNKKGKVETIRLKPITFDNGYTDLMFDKNDVERNVNIVEFKNSVKKNSLSSSITLVENSKILFDQMILKNDQVPKEYWRVMNRTIAGFYENQNGEEARLFKMAQDGITIPFGLSGSESKILAIDNQFHSIIYFDSKVRLSQEGAFNKVFGNQGRGNGQFMNPTGITCGEETERSGDYYYQIYIADFYNFRIDKVTYVVSGTSSTSGYIDPDTFTYFENVLYPYSLAFIKDSAGTSNKLWVSEAHPTTPFFSCYDAGNGELLQRFYGYYDNNTGTIHEFLPGTFSRVATYNEYFRVVSFVDNIRNCLVTCLLDNTGKAGSFQNNNCQYIEADDILLFPTSEPISSIKFQRTSNSLSSPWPYVWITSLNKIHCVKMNCNGNTQYLASTYRPYNSQSDFSSLMNSVTNNGFDALLTIEAWDYQNGVRSYLPFADMFSDSLLAYCDDSTDQMRLKATFTNDCWVQMKGYRLNKDQLWDSVKIKKINGTVVDNYNYTKFQLAGQNQASNDLFIDIMLDLPLQDYILGGEVKLHTILLPDNSNPYAVSSDYVQGDYGVNAKKTCMPYAGGCPWLYYKTASDSNYFADNNILHRSEYLGTTDITDYYKLQVEPKIEGSIINIYIAENEHDSSFINQVKLYAIDYPSNRLLGIGEDNSIVLYDSSTVVASDSVMLNSINVTNNVNFNNPTTPIVGYYTDSLYAHFTHFTPRINENKTKQLFENGKLITTKFGPGGPQLIYAIISNISDIPYPTILDKDTAGFLNATSVNSTTSSKIFARRERNSNVIIPLFPSGNKVNSFKVKWQSDFKMQSLGMATLEYSGFNSYDLPFSKASYITRTQDSEINQNLTNVDSLYGSVSSTGLIKIPFSVANLPSIPNHWIRSYIFVVNGHYIAGEENNYVAKTALELPLKYSLSQNYPNPFNPVTKINYDLPKNSKVTMVIYDILGREVTRLVNNEYKQAGRYIVEFNGLNYASGVYFYRIEAGDFVQAKKMVLVK